MKKSKIKILSFSKRNETLLLFLKHLWPFNFNPYFSKFIKFPEEVLMLMEQQSWIECGPLGNFQTVREGIMYIRKRDLSLLSVLLT